MFSIPTTGVLTVEAWIRPDVLQFPNDESTGYVHLGKGVPGQHEWVALKSYYLTNTESRPNRISGYAFQPAGESRQRLIFPRHGIPGAWIHVAFTVNTQNVGGAVPNPVRADLEGWGSTETADDLYSTAVITPQNGTAPVQ